MGLQTVGLPSLVVPSPQVPLVTGGTTTAIRFDNAASAIPLVSAVEAVAAYLHGGHYSAIHRGKGWASEWSTRVYENARRIARWFLGASRGTKIVWTQNTTGAINIVAHAFEGPVIAFAFEHHANILPWRNLTLLPVPSSPAELLGVLDTELARQPGALVAVTGASNVTGERPDIAAIAELAHAHGALVLVDAAQLAPHCKIDMHAWGIDLLALSGHKLGAPSDVGVLAVAPSAEHILTQRPPLIKGGAIVDFVHTDGSVRWLDDPQARHEPGSPNIAGVIGIATAMDTLMSVGMSEVEASDQTLLEFAIEALASVPGLQMYRMWPTGPRVGAITFNLSGMPYALLGAVLSCEFGISTRDGCFCAHPLMAHLLGLTPEQARAMGNNRRHGGIILGAVRVSLGLDTTYGSIMILADALRIIAKSGPRWSYQLTPDTSGCSPDPDLREFYAMPFDGLRKWR